LQQWLTEHRKDSDAAHDLSIGLRDNYRARWKTAINAVRASTKFRTFAALAADNKDGDDLTGEGLTKKKEGSVSPPTRSELYSDSSPDGSISNISREDGQPKREKSDESVSYLAQKLSKNKVD
jgi:calcium/calmodulin-dependent protein kinase I